MYLLTSPCIYDQTLRATGITKKEDYDTFSACIKRFDRFKLEVKTYKCPETIFLGKKRSPRNFDELDCDEFSDILAKIEAEICAMIDEYGAPAAIIGVDSSPTCGVNFTHKTELKTPGRGVLIDRFSDILCIGVREFAKYNVLVLTDCPNSAEKLKKTLLLGFMDVIVQNPYHKPLELVFDHCIITDSCFFEVAKTYCSSNNIHNLCNFEKELKKYMLLSN